MGGGRKEEREERIPFMCVFHVYIHKKTNKQKTPEWSLGIYELNTNFY